MRFLLQYLILFFLCVTQMHAVFAQCTTVPISLNERITKAKYIVIGEIMEQHCYKDKDGNIYTLNKASVHAWAKNHQAQPFVYVITYGGVLGNKAQIITDAPSEFKFKFARTRVTYHFSIFCILTAKLQSKSYFVTRILQM